MSIARHVRLAAPLAVSLLVAAAVPGTALAQAADKGKAERAAARDAYDKGTASFERGDYVKALDSFVKANALIPSVQAMYWIAQSQDKLGRVDAAVEAYEAITARADFSKLSEDKATVVRARLAALKAPPAPPTPPAPPAEPAPVDPLPAEPAPSEPPPAVDTTPPPVVNEPPPAEDPKAFLPKKNTAELGVMGGALFVSDSHNLVGPGKTQGEFEIPAWQVGVRAAFFPVSVFGIEAEWAHGFGQVEKDSGLAEPVTLPPVVKGRSANFDVVRGHLIGQLPTARLVPFALLGGGWLHGTSNQNGSDGDFLLQAGVGLKVMATKELVPRLDARVNMTQKEGGKFTDGVAVHPEILLGLSFRLGG